MAVGSRPVVSCRISLWAERGRTIARKAGQVAGEHQCSHQAAEGTDP